jgi:gliding motility-associatede transport system auxiliary component
MASQSKSKRSFSPGHRWKIGFDVVVRTVLVLAVVVMVNYLGSLFTKRFYLSSQTRIQISPRTVDVLHSMTNHVIVTLYYDTQDDFYPTILSLLNEYHAINSDLSIRTVDYVRDPGEAEKVKARYNLTLPTDKNLIIFDCDGRTKVLPGDALVQYGITGVSKDKKLEVSAVAFQGEEAFTSMLLAVLNPNPFKAYFLQGDGEPSLTESGTGGYLKFASILGQNYIQLRPLALAGDNSVPADCNLLIIAGPRTRFSNSELQKIEQYLSQGGRLLVLLNYASLQHPTGLEDILRQWGINVGDDIVQDPQNTSSPAEQDVLVYNFSSNPVVNPLTGLFLEMILPRPVSLINWQNPPADAPKVEEIAFSGPDAVLMNERGLPPRRYPLMAAVEQNEVKGIGAAHGGARIVVTGDSLFLDNQLIDYGANRDFVGYAVNWLLDRPTLLKGIGPRPVVEFRLLMTREQQRQVRWLLLAALPGGVLALGGLVWLRRRK